MPDAAKMATERFCRNGDRANGGGASSGIGWNFANMRALEPLVGEKLPTAVPDQVFDKDMTITLGFLLSRRDRDPGRGDAALGTIGIRLNDTFTRHYG